MDTTLTHPVASINGVPLHAAGEQLDGDSLRQRACTELLRQAAMRAGLLAADDAPGLDGSTSEAASAAIEALLSAQLDIPEPSEEACRRHFDAHPARYRNGDRVQVRHMLFAVTPGVDVRKLRDRAEALLLEVRCHRRRSRPFRGTRGRAVQLPVGCPGRQPGLAAARRLRAGVRARTVRGSEIGVLPRLVHSRFGLHVVEVVARETGHMPDFGAVRGAVAMALRQQSFVSALRQYLQLLAGAAEVVGVELDSADTPLVQ